MKKTWLLMVCIALAGCANKAQNAPKSLVTPAAAPVVQQPADVENSSAPAKSNLTANESCVRNLDALRAYSPKNWDKYNAAMVELNRKNSQFMSLKEGLDPQLNELLLSAYDSRMKTLCYRIETTLGQAMISRVDPMW